MSVSSSVFLTKKRLPTAAAWQAAIREAGFDMTMDTDVDLSSFSGFWPCTYAGVRAGFEFFLEASSEAALGEEEAARAERLRRWPSDTVVTFVTHSGARDLVTSVVASGVLTKLCHGVCWSQEAGVYLDGAEALAFATDTAPTTAEELAQLSAADARPTEPVDNGPFPRIVEVLIEARGSRTAHALSLETSEPAPRFFKVFLNTSALPAEGALLITGLWQLSAKQVEVQSITMDGKPCEFDAHGGVLTPGAELDYALLVRSLGNTESVLHALRAGRRRSVSALAAFAKDASSALESRRLAIVTLAQMPEESAGALPVLTALRADPKLGEAALRALEQIQAANGGASAASPRKPWWKRFVP